MDVPESVTLDQCTIEEAPAITPGADWYTYDDLAAFFRVKRNTVFAWVRQGRIPSPSYWGSTARFSRETFAAIASGIDAPGTHKLGNSPRRRTGRKGGNPNITPPKKVKKRTPKKVAAKKVAAKKGKVRK